MRIPPLNIKILLASNPLTSRILIRRLAVASKRGDRNRATDVERAERGTGAARGSWAASSTRRSRRRRAGRRRGCTGAKEPVKGRYDVGFGPFNTRRRRFGILVSKPLRSSGPQPCAGPNRCRTLLLRQRFGIGRCDVAMDALGLQSRQGLKPSLLFGGNHLSNTCALQMWRRM